MGPINPDTITFDAPVAYTDGTSLPANGIARYEYGFSQISGGPYARIVSDADFTPNAQGKQTHELQLSGFAFGQWYAAGRAMSSDNQASAWSNQAAFEVQARTPNPPAGFNVA
jgi:hypothetical protein